MKKIYNQSKTINTIKSMAEIFAKERHYLDELDRKIGDDEHGTSMNRGFTAVIEKLPELEDKCLERYLKQSDLLCCLQLEALLGPFMVRLFFPLEIE